MKIAVIKKEERSSWRSCQSITLNLEKAYELMASEEGGAVEVLTLAGNSHPQSMDEVVNYILKNEFTHIAWIDHYPHPGQFLKYFKEKSQGQRPVFLFHLFGDFVLHSSMWKDIDDLIKEDFKVKLICASHKQSELVSFLCEGDSSSPVIPFPVNRKEFFFGEEERLSKRKELNIGDDEDLFLFTGRLSYQKNIFDLIRGFSSFLKISQTKAKLVFSGPMDDLGIPYIGKEALTGTFYYHWEECLAQLPQEHRKQVLYLGNVEQSELRKLYCASDYYMSLSCHNDEDYGMSPAEALMCGLPCVLTAWGGFSSFKRYCADGVELVDVKIDEQRQAPLQTLVVKTLASLEKRKERKAITESALDSVSVEAVSKQLHSVINEDVYFFGFNKNFYKLSSLFTTNPNSPFRSATGGYSHFYRELYSRYCGEVK